MKYALRVLIESLGLVLIVATFIGLWIILAGLYLTY